MGMGTAIGLGVGVPFARSNNFGGDDMAKSIYQITRTLPEIPGDTILLGYFSSILSSNNPPIYQSGQGAFCFRVALHLDRYAYNNVTEGYNDLTNSRIYEFASGWQDDLFAGWCELSPSVDFGSFYGGVHNYNSGRDFALDAKAFYIYPPDAEGQYNYTLTLRIRRTGNDEVSAGAQIPIGVTIENLSPLQTFTEQSATGSATTPTVKFPVFHQQEVGGWADFSAVSGSKAIFDPDMVTLPELAKRVVAMIQGDQKLGLKNTYEV